MSDFDTGDLQWLKDVADGAMDNVLSVGRAERTLQRIAELERVLEFSEHAANAWQDRAEAAEAKLEKIARLPTIWGMSRRDDSGYWRGWSSRAHADADELIAALKEEGK